MPNVKSTLTLLAFVITSRGYAVCPTPLASSAAYPKGATVYYTLDSSLSQGNGMSASITQAFTDWTNANKSNGSNVSFVPADGNSHPYTYLVKASSGVYQDASGNTNINIYANTGWINYSATTTWYLDSDPIDPSDPSTFPGFVTKGQRHEIGHVMGLKDQPGDCANQTQGQSVMNYECSYAVEGDPETFNDSTNNLPSSVQPCDNNAVSSETSFGGSGNDNASGDYSCNGPAPISCDDSEPECTSTYGWYCSDQCITPEPEPCCDNCYEYCDSGNWECEGSPIVVDVFGSGFHLTDIKDGVRFRVLPNQNFYQMSWTNAAFHNGWLALDRNGNGKIDDFTELFGNATLQPKTDNPNGYAALAVFDAPENGGNGNGLIDPDDAIFVQLRVWIDDNHNGVSEPNELHTLQEAGIFKIDLDYFSSYYMDENGNEFRYKSKIWDQAGSKHDVCYDVFVKIAN